MAEALIVFASLTGNTEQMADIVAEALEARDIDVEIVDSMQADAQDFLDYDICIVGSYTYGVDGVLPDEMIDFHEELGELDLSGKIFGVFGSGDDFYEYFCAAVDFFEDQFIKTGATKGGDSVKVNLNAEDEDIVNLQALANAIADKVE
ncbi:flavodoxin [Tuanshanicoccus lijuaniae]|uniref:flavodoxin n=1 Tax=Aerococcaceae bacterium zg-1292 TaxID=2774330 RepID=UPI001935C68C|nr:flavodoxin [Aerococcaceae bacterium zg-1292]MBF6978494.1 flavodoxin [Aerococcaceae bacterium zg-BR22]MBS4455476.1 flavodoxin [Aerococcaceae bacterium zg-A91]MBS4457095.1 flavodoxin [Aerococcaceae bacterium zg-BR33]QQA37883.1 flavodoxin [Aerococcaceae bacterium zg-1292]